MNKSIMSVVMSALLVVVAILFLQNEKVVDAADNLVLLERRHPGYWTWLRSNELNKDTNGDGRTDVAIYPTSKMYLGEITTEDYQIFLRDAKRSPQNRLLYFFDGTGFDVDTLLYGKVDTNTWSVIDGKNSSYTSIEFNKNRLNNTVDVYEYLTLLQGHSFIISVKDDGACAWNEKLKKLLNADGLNGEFNYRESYLAIVENGKALKEEVCRDSIEYSSNNIYVKSAGYDSGMPESVISVNGNNYSLNERGLNIVVLDEGIVIDSVAFDTYDKLLTCTRKN